MLFLVTATAFTLSGCMGMAWAMDKMHVSRFFFGKRTILCCCLLYTSTEVQGVAAFADVKDIPDTDLAILAIPAALCPDAVEMLCLLYTSHAIPMQPLRVKAVAVTRNSIPVGSKANTGRNVSYTHLRFLL